MPSSVPADDRDGDGEKRRAERDLRAVEDAAQEIAAEVVGAKQVVGSSAARSGSATSSALGE